MFESKNNVVSLYPVKKKKAYYSVHRVKLSLVVYCLMEATRIICAKPHGKKGGYNLWKYVLVNFASQNLV